MAEELYIRVKLGLRDSDGAAVLARRLEDPRAHSYVPDLWDWFARLHPEGQVVGPDAAYLIARGSGWTGDADKFCAAMVMAGFLGTITEGFRVKGWREWAGFHFEVRAKAAAKKRRQREQSKGPSPERPEDVPGTSPGTGGENKAPEGDCPGDPSHISSLSVPSASQGGAGGMVRRARLVSPYPAGQDPTPQTTAVLAALWERGIDAAPPSERQASRVEAAIVAAGITPAVERLAAVYAAPGAQRPLTYHVAAIRGEARKPATHGDLGSEIHPWYTRLEPAEAEQARAELEALHPDFAGAPLGIKGVPGTHPVDAIEDLYAKWRQVVEAR